MGQNQRLRAARREAIVLDGPDDGLEPNGGVIVEVDDQPPAPPSQPAAPATTSAAPAAPSPAGASADGDADEPLDVLKRKFDDLKAEKEAEERRRKDAETRENELRARTREQAARLDNHAFAELAQHKSVLEQAYASEELKGKDAKRRYSAALAEGNYDAAADAQEEMVRVNAAMGQYASAYQEVERREKTPRTPPPQSQDDQFEAALNTMHPKVAAWAREHRADVLDPAKQRLAYAADAMAQAKGYTPGSDDYIEYMDQEMGYAPPAGADPDAGQQPVRPAAPRPGMRTPAAPPSRTSSSSQGTRRVHLTQDDKRQARAYGVSDEEYAKWKIKAETTEDTVADPRRMQIKVYGY